MPAFNVTKRHQRRRRTDTIRLVAFELGVNQRTLRRWIAERPELRPVLRAYRHGKQWRLHVPETEAEFERYKEEVLSAVGSFHRRRAKRATALATQKVSRALGFGNEQRERDLRILREAIRLKIATAKVTGDFKAQSKAHFELDSAFDQAGNSMGLARIVAAKHGCDVSDVPKYIDAQEANSEIQRLRDLWPAEQWKDASVQVERLWRDRTLTEAAYELAKNNERITGRNLAPLLFLSERHEVEWKLKEFLKRIPGSYSSYLTHDRRGISLRLFRQRYKRKDIENAKRAALREVRAEQPDNPYSPEDQLHDISQSEHIDQMDAREAAKSVRVHLVDGLQQGTISTPQAAHIAKLYGLQIDDIVVKARRRKAANKKE